MFNGNHDYTAKDQLKDGTAVIVRAIRASDKDQLQEIMKDVSAESRYFRFFGAKKLLSEQELKYFTEIDFNSHIGLLVSLCDGSDAPIAVGRYITLAQAAEEASAELAMLVREHYQGQGIGRMLLNHLAHIAVTKGVSEFVCYIMSENSKMINMLRHSDYPVSQQPEANSVVKLSVDLMPRSA
ncbi:MAG: GNAT family N-acetyltransferase [Cyanobacteria bacterium SZAS LIN-2]|nr:GNAT family N-acetyltransferase [Cyanobacteria bacterium SZAS LIN-3]MBS1997276.1 GNAT family N-acetyltransferase [Cyanobacteria bacterium SZAS LIN-2]MBS2007547.1 GNAT family N-acetyltransferase [Cyanobacteria bacterium SZAS TMP-1]